MRNLENAFKQFYKRCKSSAKKKGYPKFKSKHAKQSYTIGQGNTIKVKDNKISISLFREGIKGVISKPINGKIKKATVTKTKTNKYFISITYECDKVNLLKTGNQVGLDLGISKHVTTSVNESYDLPDYQTIDFKIRKQQRRLSRKVRGSNRYKKCRLMLNKLYEQKNQCS